MNKTIKFALPIAAAAVAATMLCPWAFAETPLPRNCYEAERAEAGLSELNYDWAFSLTGREDGGPDLHIYVRVDGFMVMQDRGATWCNVGSGDNLFYSQDLFLFIKGGKQS